MQYKVCLILWVYNFDKSHHLRGELEVTLPFVPQESMCIQYKDMEPLEIKQVTWHSDSGFFTCDVEPKGTYEFDLNSDVEDLAKMLDVLRDAKKYGWSGLDKVYRH